ncbi:hypothetical protein M434DRAFT_395530 [Hypoxylon sp. CO27-5]|nr:hypothetical protein M434DRAFT_395530 [Hypoxylon sp. CO27-5]
MSSIIKTAASLACLATIALAGPINIGSAQRLSRRGDTDCPAGKVFYACANGYRGCFEKDPCALPPIATTSLASDPTTTSVATEATTTPPATCTSGASIWQPTMYNLFPAEPDKTQPAVSYLQVQEQENQAPLEQVAVFQGIPATATKCSLNWAQAAEAERTFVVDHSGYTSVLQLTGFPAAGEPISSASIAKYEPADQSKAKHPDFTFWDKQSKDAQTHSAGQVDCAENIYLKVALDTLNGDGRVYLEQDAKNGFYVTYEC